MCVHFCRAVRPLTSCYIITSNGLIALFAYFTQVLPYQTYCLLDPNTKVGSCMCVHHTLLAQHCMAPWPTFLVSHPLLESVPPHIIIGLLWLPWTNICSIWWLPYHDPPHVLLAISGNVSIFSFVGGTCFSNHLPRNSGGTVFRRDTSVQ